MTETQTVSAFSRKPAVSNIYPLSFDEPIDEPKVRITEPDRNSWWDQVIERLQDLVSLEIGWDGYQGEPVRFENAAFALRVLEAICFDDTPTPHIVPGTSGDLQIEWHTHAAEIELDILAPNSVHAWISTPETKPEGEEFVLTTDFTKVVRVIRKMTECARDQTAAA